MPICQFCKKEFQVIPSRINTAKYCSKKCQRACSPKGKNHWNWKNGRKKSKGYILILKPEHPYCNCRGYVLEHRLVLEKQIGRYLKPEEIPHHVNEIKDDNRPHMLMAFVNHSAHIRFHKNPNNVKPEEIIFDGRKLKTREEPIK